MAFTIKPDGTILVDSVDELREVLTVRAQVAAQQAKQEANTSAPVRPQASPEEAAKPQKPSQSALPIPDAGFRELYEQAHDSPQQQRLLQRLVAARGEPVADAVLRADLGLNSNLDLRGLLIGIVRRATSRGLPNPIFREVNRFGRGKRTYRYGATREFCRAMESYGFSGRIAV